MLFGDIQNFLVVQLYRLANYYECIVPIHFKQLRLAKLEREAVNGNVVILSDIWLDNEEVILLAFVKMVKLLLFLRVLYLTLSDSSFLI